MDASFAEFRFDRAVRDCGSQSNFAREIANAQSRRRGSRAAHRQDLGELLGLEMKEASKKELLEKLERAEQAFAVSA